MWRTQRGRDAHAPRPSLLLLFRTLLLGALVTRGLGVRDGVRKSLLVDGLKTFSQEEKIAVQLRGNLQNANEPWRRRLVWLMDSNGQNRP